MAYTNLGNGTYRNDSGKLFTYGEDNSDWGYSQINDPTTGLHAFAPGFAAPDSYGAVSRARDITNDPRLGTVMGTRGDDNEYQTYNGQRLTRYDPEYWTKEMFYGGLDSLEPSRQAGLNNIAKIGNQYYVPQAAYDQSQAAMQPYARHPSSFDNFLEGLFSNGPMIASAAFLGPAIAGAMGGAGAGAMASADAIGLAQMGQAAGLTGSALSEFVASGGTLGSTAAGAGGIASGFTASPYDVGPNFTSNVNDFSPSNWYDSMTPQDLGQAVNPWTTNPSFADLGGTAGAAGGATGIAGLVQQLSTLTGLSTSAIERLGGAGISSLASMYGASKLGQASMDAANRVAAANQSATQLQSQMYQDQVARQQPFYQAGLNALPSYTKGVMPGGDLVRPFAATDFQADPGYGFRMSEGLKALDRSAASRGNLLSGATLKGAQRFGQDIASNEYNNAYNRYVGNQATQRGALGNLAGFAPPAAAAMGAAGSNYGTNVNNLGINTATTYGNADMTGAAARQSAYMGAGGAFANALSPNPLNAYLNKQLGIA